MAEGAVSGEPAVHGGVVQTATLQRLLPDADETGMASLVVGVVEPAGKCPEGLADQLDPSRRIGHEDEIEVDRVGLEELEDAQTHILYAGGRQLRRRRGRVRVSEQARCHVRREPVQQGLAVERRPGMIEVDGICQPRRHVSHPPPTPCRGSHPARNSPFSMGNSLPRKCSTEAL